ncbi:MAG: DUF1127 domain-containing protein [Sulfitobacter sp.]|nr:DUF1127 domain-containing protein [Sulfitobacter sp.]
MAHARPDLTASFGILSQPGTPLVALLAVGFAVCVTTWATRRRTRLALSRLEPWQLRDVGLTPAQASHEASRVFWQG